MKNTKKSKETFGKRGYLLLEREVRLSRLIHLATRSWIKFCNLPLGIKGQIPYIGDSHGIGFEFKGPTKQNFDISTLINVNHLLSRVRYCGVTADFIRNSLALGKMMGVVVEDLLETLELEILSYTHFVRFLHYFPNTDNCMLASPHIDKGGLTIHLYESSGGFQFLPFVGEDWIDLSASKKIMVTPSMQAQYVTLGKYKALCHRVVSTGTSQKEGRFSIVCFVVFDGLQYDKETHGPLNEFQPGFNYRMRHEEFCRFFVG